MAPTQDSDIPPETWITAAPQDTLTTRDPTTGQAIPPVPGTIPFRYHIYWSGSDQDGQVVGFYWAVVETVETVPIPSLPGPKPRDYHYTTKRDSVFIFNVFEDTNNRQHAFYIYAVDDKGKADPTPARVIFNSLDRFPPIPVIDADSHATGLILRPSEAWTGSGPLPVQRETTIALRDTFNRRTVVSDVVPMSSQVYMHWHSEITVADNPAVAYKYKIGEGNEVDFVQVPATVTSTTYNTTDNNRLGPGLKIFTLRAIDQAGGARTSPETTRRFYTNLAPDTWFSGPDTTAYNYTLKHYLNGQLKYRFYQVPGGTSTPSWTNPIPGSLLGPDSVNIMPAIRKPSKTFFEIYSQPGNDPDSPGLVPYGHRIYVHTDGDTIHMNSWVCLFGGGFDPDSPYSLRITINNPNLPGIGTKPVLTSGPANGSPVGFHFIVPVRFDTTGAVSTFPESQIYPLSDPAFVPEPHIAGYQGMQLAGRAYALLRSEDGNQGKDARINDPIAFMDSIENGLISPGSPRYALKDKVLTFYVDRAPYLSLDDPRWEPRPNEQFFTRSIRLRFDLANDDDPYDTNQRQVGGPSAGGATPLVLRFSVLLHGKVTGSNPPRDTVYAPANLARAVGVNLDQQLAVPPWIAGPNVSVDIELCDCTACEAVPGQGRCRRYPPIPVIIPAMTPELSTAASQAAPSSTGPGSSGASSRSKEP